MKKFIDKLQKAWNSLLYKLMFKNYRECDKPVKVKMPKPTNMKAPK